MSNVIPCFKVLALDETGLWRKDIVAMAGRLIGLYVVDVNRLVHAAEWTPSYEAYYLGTEFTNHELDDRASDWLDQAIRDADNKFYDRVQYFHVHTIQDEQFTDEYGDVSEEWDELLDEHEGNRATAWYALFEQVLEYYQGNSPDIGEWT